MDAVIQTLGPAHTDADWLARQLSSQVRHAETFRLAMTEAVGSRSLALVACGCRSETECWVELHFEFLGRLQIQRCFEAATQPMCLAHNPLVEGVDTVASYRALEGVVATLVPAAVPVWCRNKVDAVDRCRDGRAKLCIGSLPVVQRCAGLEIVHVFHPTMVWCLYGAVPAPAAIHRKIDTLARVATAVPPRGPASPRLAAPPALSHAG